MASLDTVPAASTVPDTSELSSPSATPATSAALEPCDPSLSPTLETSQGPLILTVPSLSISEPDSASSNPNDSTIVVPTILESSPQSDRLLAVSIMTDSIYSSSDYDAYSDCESIMEAQCYQAHTVRLINPGKASVVDLMREEKPIFKRASQMLVLRPLTRPFISPIQPSSRTRRDTSSDDGSNYSQDSPSNDSSRTSLDSVPRTPTFEHSDDALSCSPISDDSLSAPDTPKTSLEQEPQIYAAYSISPPTPSATTGLKSRVKIPSRLRLFPKRSSTTASDLMGSPHYLTTPTKEKPYVLTRSTSDVVSEGTPRQYFRKATSPMDRASFAQFIRLPATEEDTPLTAQQIETSRAATVTPPPPARSIWRDASRSRTFLATKLKRAESRVELSAY